MMLLIVIFQLDSCALMKIGKRALKNGELHIAERSFAKVIRKEKLGVQSTKRNPESYYYLAEVLQTKAAKEDIKLAEKHRLLLQAASLYNFVNNCLEANVAGTDSVELPRSLSCNLKDIQDSLVLSFGKNPANCRFNCDDKKKDLQRLRNEVKDVLNSLEERYANQTETNENVLRDLFVEQTNEIRELCEMISSRIKQLFSQIIAECLDVLGGEPECEYEVIVLGSLARDEMTPYSDLEWAILISSEDEKSKVFFRNLTNLVHLQVSLA